MTGFSRASFPGNEDRAFMRIDGSWRLCDDGIVRPVVWAEIRASDGSWVQAFFLTDCAADRTVLSENVWRSLGLPGVATTDRLEGVGGSATSVVVETQIRMARGATSPTSSRSSWTGPKMSCPYLVEDISTRLSKDETSPGRCKSSSRLLYSSKALQITNSRHDAIHNLEASRCGP